MKKRVLVDIQAGDYLKAGIGTYIREFVRSCSLGNGDFEYIFTPSGQSKLVSKLSTGGKVAKLLFHVIYLLRKQLWLPILALWFRADFILCPDYVAPIFVFGKKKVIVLHDAFFWKKPAEYGRYWSQYYTNLIRFGISSKSILITTSEQSMKEIGEFLITSIRPKVIYQPPKKEVSYVVEKKGFASENCFLHVGTFEYRKNLPFLVRAFCAFREKHPGFKESRLVLAGSYNDNRGKKIKQEIDEILTVNNCSDQVEILGRVSDERLISLYRQASVYIFPSNDEGYGIPLLESFSNLLPVIISNTPTLIEVSNGAAMVFDLNSIDSLVGCMNELCGNSILYERYQQRGLQRAREISSLTFIQSVEKALLSDEDC